MTIATAAWAQGVYDRFFDDFYFPDNPTTATASGIHKYDSELEDYSKAGVARRTAKLKNFEAEFAKLPQSADRDLVLSNIRAALHELESVKMWERNPDIYSSGISSSAFTIMSRKFAAPEVRMKALIGREGKMPQVLADARVNLKNPPKMYTEIALEQLPGIEDFFAHDVPLAFKDVKDAKLLKDFETSNNAVIAALKDYEKFLKTDLLARSNGDYRLGEEKFSRKLLYEEMVDVPLDRLLKIGYDNLHENQKKFQEVAARIDPKKTPREILNEMEKDHPAPDKLLDAMREACVKLLAFIQEKKIITVPSQVLPILQETPPFARALTIASMDTPGPYEEVAKEAFYNVTLPEKNWPADRVEDYMKGFHKGLILSVSIHEAYPGHYIQFLWMQHVDSRVRKLLGASSNAEGWAHYSEQMVLDEGYAKDDLRMRLGQLQDALLRNVRFIVGIEMHTGKRSFEESVTAFEKEGYQPHEVALKEAKRGTSDPTYLYYTLGKLQILKLRDDYKKKMGPAYSLQAFHDALMQQGFPPIKIVRKALLGDDSPTL